MKRMEARSLDRLLTAGFAVAAALYALLFWIFGRASSNALAATLLSAHALPMFLLQWRLCRVERRRWPRWAPLVLVAVIALIGALYLFGDLGGGWDALFGGLLLCWCAAPAAGICLGWMAGGGHTAKRIAGAGLLVMLAVYVGLKALGFPLWWTFVPLDVPALAVLAAGFWLFFKK